MARPCFAAHAMLQRGHLDVNGPAAQRDGSTSSALFSNSIGKHGQCAQPYIFTYFFFAKIAWRPNQRWNVLALALHLQYIPHSLMYSSNYALPFLSIIAQPPTLYVLSPTAPISERRWKKANRWNVYCIYIREWREEATLALLARIYSIYFYFVIEFRVYTSFCWAPRKRGENCLVGIAEKQYK